MSQPFTENAIRLAQTTGADKYQKAETAPARRRDLTVDLMRCMFNLHAESLQLLEVGLRDVVLDSPVVPLVPRHCVMLAITGPNHEVLLR